MPALEPFDALKTSRLGFDFLAKQGAAVNLYVRAEGTLHSIRLTGSGAEAEGVKVLGAAPLARADGRWHSVSVDLTALLKPLYPNEGDILVQEVFLGAPTGES